MWLILSTMLSILLKQPAPFAENICTFVAGLSTNRTLFLLLCVFNFLCLLAFVLLSSLGLSFSFDSVSFFQFDSFCLETEKNPSGTGCVDGDNWEYGHTYHHACIPPVQTVWKIWFGFRMFAAAAVYQRFFCYLLVLC